MVWAFLRQSLWSVVNQWGTGAAARIPGLDVAGKTGTTQIIAKSRAEKGGGPRVVRRPWAGAPTRRSWWWSSSSAAGRAARWPLPSRARS